MILHYWKSINISIMKKIVSKAEISTRELSESLKYLKLSDKLLTTTDLCIYNKYHVKLTDKAFPEEYYLFNQEDCICSSRERKHILVDTTKRWIIRKRFITNCIKIIIENIKEIDD